MTLFWSQVEVGTFLPLESGGQVVPPPFSGKKHTLWETNASSGLGSWRLEMLLSITAFLCPSAAKGIIKKQKLPHSAQFHLHSLTLQLLKAKSVSSRGKALVCRSGSLHGVFQSYYEMLASNYCETLFLTVVIITALVWYNLCQQCSTEKNEMTKFYNSRTTRRKQEGTLSPIWKNLLKSLMPQNGVRRRDE